MAYVQRLILALSFLVVLSANAAFVPQSRFAIGWYPDLIRYSKEDACIAGYARRTSEDSTYRYVYQGTDGSPGAWGCLGERLAKADGTSYGSAAVSLIELSAQCPPNSTQVGNECVCSAGHSEYNNNGAMQCKSDAETSCEQAAIMWNVLGNDRGTRIPGSPYAADGSLKPSTSIVCHVPPDSPPGTKGCKHQFTRDFAFSDHQGQWFQDGISWAVTNPAEVGGSLECTPGTGDNEPKKEQSRDKDCDRGYKGTVNGVEVCVDATTGNTQGTNQDRTTDSAGKTVDTTYDVNCKGETCTVREIKKVTNANGTPGATTTTTFQNVNRGTFCQQHPKNSVCGQVEDRSGTNRGQGDQWGGVNGQGNGGGRGNGSGGDGDGDDEEGSFDGACASGFQCTGDAIQCAIAKEQHIRACKLFDDKTAESDLYDENKSKEGDQTKDNPLNDTVDINGRIDSSDALGGGACIGDLNITVSGTAITLPLSTLCPTLAMLGNLLVAVSMLVALRIITRG